MIIWISGPYGVGKSTLAKHLADRVENACIFDAEEVGNAVRETYPEAPSGVIFEDYPLWGEFCYQLLKDIHKTTGKNIIVPMTLIRKESYKIIKKLRRAGIVTKLIVLEASYQTVHDRILMRGEKEGCWCMQNIEASRAGAIALPGIHIPTDGKTVNEIGESVLTRIV